MKLERVLPYMRTLLQATLSKGDLAIDATVGNGNDTLFLSQLVGESGHIYGFDIQEQAILSTTKLLETHNVYNGVTLYQASHDTIIDTIPTELHGHIKAAVFNLGYLPGGNKEIVTKPTSTIQALEQLLSVLAVGGIIIIVIYSGHPEGKIERDEILHYASTLNQKDASVLQYKFINQINNPPFIIAIEKR
ncbi:class I SAM-dependent methyltransferase [Cytobacillus sp. IB215316]|uniref:class I SAM-dependent methyltransferase n=1 Tax=Cytobacillus sp. IB215316 TaxID=3097354 RepID=UPI002A0DD6E2|nr:class I SAM-dependent methyltransferase [Cytobacillus sp. IB215316]MDX8359220.1 class I SAM-dependent methyltransferase [Cytobacillus sp. IB215316]